MTTSLLPYITGSGGALVVLAIVLYLILEGKLHTDGEFQRQEEEIRQLRTENGQLRVAVDIERKTLNETASAGAVTNQLIGALTQIATGNRPRPPEITAGDLGL